MHRSLHCYVYLDRPYDRVRQWLADQALETFRAAVGAAESRVRGLASQLRGELAGVEVDVDVEVRVDRFRQTPIGGDHPLCELDFSWRARSAPALFPSLSGQLVAHPVGPEETQLALFGTYQPPLGALGGLADAVLLHRLAEAAVHRAVHELAARMLDEIAPA